MKNFQVGIVIVTYNRFTLLKECLECVLKQTRPFDKILIVNNASTDSTKEFLDRWQTTVPQAQIFHSPKNLGGAGGFSMGLTQLYPQVDYTVLIDDDAMLEAEFLKNLLAARQEDCLAYSGTVVMQGKIDLEHRRRISNRILMKQTAVPIQEYQQATFLYDASSFCGLMVASKLVEKIGLPRADYFIWYDDTEYSLRLRKYTSIMNVNCAVLNHKTNVSVGNRRLSWKSFYGYRNQWDSGRTYARFPIVYLIYRYFFHTVKILLAKLYCLKSTDEREKNYWNQVARLHTDVIQAAHTGQMGLHPDYLPGKSLYQQVKG